MFARPKKPSDRQRIGLADHSFMEIAKPLVDNSCVNDMKANPLFSAGGNYNSSSGRHRTAGGDGSGGGKEGENHLPAMNTKTTGNNDNEAKERKPRKVKGITIGFGHASNELDHRPKDLLGMTREQQQEMCQKNREKTDSRVGDNKSFSYNLHASTFIDKRAAQRMFRVLCIKHPTPGSEGRVVFDPLDGRIFSVAPGFHNRVSHNVLLYDNKKSALSERLPPNQIGAGNSGNGRYARILCSFGKCSPLFQT